MGADTDERDDTETHIVTYADGTMMYQSNDGTIQEITLPDCPQWPIGVWMQPHRELADGRLYWKEAVYAVKCLTWQN